ncbi:hypothetical protein BJF78_11210 [Pseudonocardia sp. CNS-139]|nr:hypothetical protein BJF78_11210 [Pseudonocardia sp. CNS-139]
MIGGAAGEVLGLCDEFFRSHASPAVHAELRGFLTGLGHHPVAGLGAFLAELSSTALHAETGRPRHDEITRAAELTRLLAQASLLPAGAHTRDVGAYRALEVMVRGPGEYWATADVVDEDGSGHLEVTVASASRRSPLTLADLQQYRGQHPGVSGSERHQPDGSVITTCTTTSPEPGRVITQRAILARPDGTYIDVMTSNEDARTSGRTRPTPPLDAETVLGKVADLRP